MRSDNYSEIVEYFKMCIAEVLAKAPKHLISVSVLTVESVEISVVSKDCWHVHSQVGIVPICFYISFSNKLFCFPAFDALPSVLASFNFNRQLNRA